MLTSCNLPYAVQIHHTFHVSQLKAFHEVLPIRPYIPTWLQGLDYAHDLIPKAILARRIAKKRVVVVIQWLVQWRERKLLDTLLTKLRTFSLLLLGL